MKKLYDLAVKTGSYTDAQGQEKGRWKNIGAVMDGDNGKFIFLDRSFNPAGVGDASKESILVSMFEPKPKGDNGFVQQQPSGSGGQQFAASQDQQMPPLAENGFDNKDIPFANPYKHKEYLL